MAEILDDLIAPCNVITYNTKGNTIDGTNCRKLLKMFDKVKI